MQIFDGMRGQASLTPRVFKGQLYITLRKNKATQESCSQCGRMVTLGDTNPPKMSKAARK